MSGVRAGGPQGGVAVLPRAADWGVDGEEGRPFAYLFASPAAKRAERVARRREDRPPQGAAEVSKHERALAEAKERGLNVDGMTRKEVRQFLHLTVSREQEEAERHRKEFRPHELMDDKLQWYQQGPHPVDLIAEKLVVRKAMKKGRQQGLKYNYLMPHPSWLAKREQKRRERVVVGLGRRYVFDDEGRMMDVFGAYVTTGPDADTPLGESHAVDNSGVAVKPERAAENEDESEVPKKIVEDPKQDVPCVTAPPNVCADVLVDPRRACHSLVHAVVRDRRVAAAIQRANMSTTYISSSLVMGPSIGLEDTAKDSPAVHKRAREAPSARQAKVVSRRSKAASFEPYLPES